MRRIVGLRRSVGAVAALFFVIASTVGGGISSASTLGGQSNGTGLQSARASLQQASSSGEGPFVLHNVNSGKCLDVDMTFNSSPDNPYHPWTRIQDWDCNYGDNQQWQSSADVTNYGFEIKNIASQKCLDVFGNATQDNVAVGVFPCKESVTPNQFFTFIKVNPTLDYYEVRNNNGQCIGPPADDNFSNGVGIGVYHCNGNAYDAQRLQWTLYPNP